MKTGFPRPRCDFGPLKNRKTNLWNLLIPNTKIWGGKNGQRCSATSTRPMGPIVRKIPKGDTKERMICEDCGFINYANPKMVVGVVATWKEKILLAKRAIEPRKGYWTLPAGFMECEETSADGAKREAFEEANANVRVESLLAIHDIPRISQVYIWYRAKLLDDNVFPGEESQEVGLFKEEDIPWNDLAFPSVREALKFFIKGHRDDQAVHTLSITESITRNPKVDSK